MTTKGGALAMQCAYCLQKKGKRSCPGLHGIICPSCCGQYRLQRISCPKECIYLAEGEIYAGKKLEQMFLAMLREVVESFPEEKKDALSEAIGHLLAVVCIVLSADPKIRSEELTRFLQDIRSEFQLIITPAIGQLSGPLVAMRDQALERLKKLSPSHVQAVFPEALEGLLLFFDRLSGKRSSASFALGLRAFLEGMLGLEWVQSYDWRKEPDRVGRILIP